MRDTEPASLDGSATQLTNHAMLVVWGHFARQIGLIEVLEALPIPQRQREHTPQTKLMEFLVAILGGCAYLQDISHGPHPLDKDQAVAAAWGQPGWADYSGVSRTLAACTAETAAQVAQALQSVSQPFIDREVMLALRERGVIVYDGDLASRPVSNTSTTYPDAEFGWMSDVVGLGYQAAMVSMHSPTYGRLWLSVQQHPGSVVSSTQAEALVCAAEARTGVRPRRRPELLAGHIAQQTAQWRAAESKLAQDEAQITKAQKQLWDVERERVEWQQRVAALTAEHQAKNKPERAHSRLAQARQKLDVRVRRCPRRQLEVHQAEKRAAHQRGRLAELRAELEQLQQRHARLVEDNRTNLSPIRAIFRLDAGFGSGPNVALVIEMGYEVYSKPTNYQVTATLRRRVTPETTWAQVGRNAEMVAWQHETIANCPYLLDVALERFHTGDKQRHSTLLHYGAAEVTADLLGWFACYNGRQTIEAGIKEGKHVFQMHHLKVRSPTGLPLQEQFTAFAANFVRWAALWLCQTCPQAEAPFDRPRPSVKQMVRIAANTSAWVIWQPQGCLVRFTELSAFAGVELLLCSHGYFQLPLRLFKSCDFPPL
jgi:hypothetical protein